MNLVFLFVNYSLLLIYLFSSDKHPSQIDSYSFGTYITKKTGYLHLPVP